MDRDARERLASSRAHGRLDAAQLLILTALCFVFAVPTLFGASLLCFILIASALAMCFFTLRYLPFYDVTTNNRYAQWVVAYSWATLMTGLSYFREVPEVRPPFQTLRDNWILFSVVFPYR